MMEILESHYLMILWVDAVFSSFNTDHATPNLFIDKRSSIL